MLRALLIVCLLMCGATPEAEGRPSDVEFAIGLAFARLRLSLGTLTPREAAWLQKQIDKYVTRYRGQQNEECWVFSYRLGISQCGYDCDCAGRAVYELLGPHLKQIEQYGIKTPYDAGGR